MEVFSTHSSSSPGKSGYSSYFHLITVQSQDELTISLKNGCQEMSLTQAVWLFNVLTISPVRTSYTGKEKIKKLISRKKWGVFKLLF